MPPPPQKAPKPCNFDKCLNLCITNNGGARGLCREHYRALFYYVDTACIDCAAPMRVRRDAFTTDSGRCRTCASKETANRPDVKSKASVRARTQVLAQGGIPNARHFTPERVRGAANNKWKGGISPPRIRDMGTARYVAWRKAVFDRDNYTCQFCGQRGGKIEADHIKPYSTHVNLRYEISNGRTLCKPCHKTTDTYCGKAVKLSQVGSTVLLNP